jgi:hypothetical protein
MSVLAWHFTGATLRDGRPVPESRQTWQRLRDGGADPCTSLTVVMAEHRMRTNGKFMAAWLTGDGTARSYPRARTTSSRDSTPH